MQKDCISFQRQLTELDAALDGEAGLLGGIQRAI